MDWYKKIQRKEQKVFDRYVQIKKKKPYPKFIRDVIKELK